MDKDLALAFKFDNAPADVKAAAQKNLDAYTRMKTTENQCVIWQKEKNEARAQFDETQITFKAAVEAWTRSEGPIVAASDEVK
jgi:hypothetical protein